MQPSFPIHWLWCQGIVNSHYIKPLCLCNFYIIDGLILSFFRSNVLGTKFTVYDGGENPDKKPFVKECESVRQELAAICYVSLKWPPESKNILSNTRRPRVEFFFCFAGTKHVGIKRPQKDDSNHPWYVGEWRKSLYLPKKRKCLPCFFSFGHTWLCVLCAIPHIGACLQLVVGTGDITDPSRKQKHQQTGHLGKQISQLEWTVSVICP